MLPLDEHLLARLRVPLMLKSAGPAEWVKARLWLTDTPSNVICLVTPPIVTLLSVSWMATSRTQPLITASIVSV